MNMGGDVVVLYGDMSYMQSKETNKKTRINYEHGQYFKFVSAPVKEGEVAKETEKALTGYWPRSVRFIRVPHGWCKCRKSA